MFIEVQPEAKETQTLIQTGHQQHQELLDDALREEQGDHRGKKIRLHLKMHQTQVSDSCSWWRLRLVPGRSG